jgi:hypothetical protein|nr:MAG TPA: hypothetical protein [Caudoviricetes sp.]
MVFEDRISKYPGRWTLVREDGSSEVVTLVRNDEPIKDGTPINASTLNELSTVAGAINAKEEAVSAANSAAEERAKAEQAAKNAAKDVSAIVKADSENAALSATAAKTSEINSKSSESQSATYLRGTKEYFEQVRTITIGAQGWYATPEALKAAVPIGENGWWAVVGTTDTIWTWDGDTGAWVDTRKEVDLSDYLTQDQIRKLLEQYMPLRPATAGQLGGVKVGDYLDIAADGTLSGKTLYDTIAASVAVKSEARLVWNTHVTSPNKFTTWDVQIPDNVDKICITKGRSNSSSNKTEKSIARGGTTTYNCYYDFTITFQTNGILHVANSYKTLYPLELWIDGYHYPTLADLLTETQAAQADTDALAVDHEYRIAMLELGMTDDTTTDTTT